MNASTTANKARAAVLSALAVGLFPFLPPVTTVRQAGLFVAAASTSTTPSSASSNDYCDGDTAMDACFADAECSACFAGWGVETSSAASACEEEFAAAAASGGAACEQQGASFCCNVGDQATAEACMANGQFVKLFGCFMTDFECAVEDIPCYDASAVYTTAPTPSPESATGAPTASPTVNPYGIRGLETTASPSSSPGDGTTSMPSALTDACAVEAAACVADEVCEAECYQGVAATAVTDGTNSTYSQCQLDYLLEEGSSSVGPDPNVCDVVGAAFCCSGGISEAEEETSASSATCLTNDASRGLWSCVYEFYGCSMDEALCNDPGSSDGSFVTSEDVSTSPSLDLSSDEDGSTGEDGAASGVSGAVGVFSRGREWRGAFVAGVVLHVVLMVV